MNKFGVMIVVLFSTSLVTLSPINADSSLIGVEILRGAHSQRRLVDHGIHRSYVWEFENKEYTIILAIDQQWYNRIRNQQHRRRYDHGHFPPMVYEGVKSLRELIKEFNEEIPRTWSKERKVNFVLAFVQAIPYKNDKMTGYDEYYKYPTETLLEGQGDCEDSSMLFAAILSGLGFESVLFIPPGHLAVGVKGNFRGGHVLYGNDAYYYCETTHKGWRLGNIPREYVGIQVEVMPITPNPVRPKQVTPQIIPPRPTLPSPPSSQTALKNGIDLFYKARFNEAIKSLQSALDRLSDPERRAEAYIYLGMAESGFGKSIPELKDRFQKALRENPNQKFDHKKFKDWFDEVHEKSIGELTISASLPQTEISIYGNGMKRKNLGSRPKSIKLFKGNYTIEGNYEGKSIKDTVKVEPNFHKEFELEIPPIVKHELVSKVSVGEIIPLTLHLTSSERPSQVKIYYGLYGTNNKKLKEDNKRMRLVRRHTASSTWTYEGDLPAQQRMGSIRYYIEAEYESSLVVREPKNQHHRISIIDDTPPSPPSNQPPRIELSDTIQTAEVNQQIRVAAKVTDDTSIKSIHFYYGFSQFPGSEPKEYKQKNTYIGPTTDTEFIGTIPKQTRNGYVWYYLTAIDEEGKDATSEKRVIAIQSRYYPPRKLGTPEVNDPDIPKHQGIWVNYAWPSEVFEDGGSIFDWNRGDAINFTYLREGRTYQTLGVQLDYSYQNPSNMNATFQWGPALGKSPITFTLLTGITGYRKPDSTPTTSTLTTDISGESIYITPILGAGLKYYPLNRVAIDAIGSLKIPSVFDATSLYHYEMGARVYITDELNLKIGYSQWYLGSQNIARIQVGLGITF